MFYSGEEGAKQIENALDPTKELAVDADLMLEGDMLEMAKRMEEKINRPYEEATPIRMGGGNTSGKTQQQLIAYRKKRNKKNKAAKKSRKINRKK